MLQPAQNLLNQSALVYPPFPLGMEDRLAAPRLPTRVKATDLLTMDLPEMQYVVEDLLPVGLTLLAGKPKLGKSWLALQLSLAIAGGHDFLQSKTSQGDVLYLGLEDNLIRLRNRLQLLDPSEQWEGLECWTQLDLSYEDRIAVLREWLQEHSQAKAVMIDVWGRFAPEMNGKDEYGQVTRALQPLQALAHEFGIAILLVHHAKKGESDIGDVFDQVLGSTALTSNADATMLLTRSRNQEQGTLSLTGRDIEERSITLVRQGVRWEFTAAPPQPALPQGQQEVLAALRNGHHTALSIAGHIKKNRTAVQNTLQVLLQAGLVVQEGRGAPYYLPDQKSPGNMTDIGDIAANSEGDAVAQQEEDPVPIHLRALI